MMLYDDYSAVFPGVGTSQHGGLGVRHNAGSAVRHHRSPHLSMDVWWVLPSFTLPDLRFF